MKTLTAPVLVIVLGCLSCSTHPIAKGDAAVGVPVPGDGEAEADAPPPGDTGAGLDADAPDLGGVPDAAISCGVLRNQNNEKAVGAGCTPDLAEVPACGSFMLFCTARVLDDRWPKGAPGHCSRRCQSDGDCGVGLICCDARPGKFCMTRMNGRPELTFNSCARPCPTNEDCSPDTLCCEELGRICISTQCSGVCQGN